MLSGRALRARTTSLERPQIDKDENPGALAVMVLVPSRLRYEAQQPRRRGNDTSKRRARRAGSDAGQRCRLEESAMQIGALSFAAETIAGSVRSEFLSAGATIVDVFSDEERCVVDDLRSFGLELALYEGAAVLLVPPEPEVAG